MFLEINKKMFFYRKDSVSWNHYLTKKTYYIILQDRKRIKNLASKDAE
jgi:hypothetical protein